MKAQVKTHLGKIEVNAAQVTKNFIIHRPIITGNVPGTEAWAVTHKQSGRVAGIFYSLDKARDFAVFIQSLWSGWRHTCNAPEWVRRSARKKIIYMGGQ